MGSSRISPQLILLDVSAKNDKDSNAMVISGKMLLFGVSGNFDNQNSCLKLRVEGKEKESVQRVFATGIHKKLHMIFHGRNSVSQSQESIFVEKEYELSDNQIEEGKEISF